MSIVGLLVAVIIICLIWWALTSVLAAFSVGNPIATLVKVVFVVMVVLWLLSAFGVVGGGPVLRVH